MEVTGTIMSQKYSENEFSYWWCIPEFLDGYSYQSPKFGSTCREFSDCHLEIKTHIGPQRISRFFVCSSYHPSELKFTFSTSLEHGIHPQPKGIFSSKCYDFVPCVKIFAFDTSQHVFYPYFIFKLNLTICKDFNAADLFSDSNIVKNKNCFANKGPFVKGTKEIGSLSSNPAPKEKPKHADHIEYPKELIRDLQSLYTSGDMSDLEIRIGESILRAHKTILCARSPVIQRMMENNFIETSSNIITITDCPVSLFEKFLSYIYTGELEDTSMEAVMTLYILGDKYDVLALREACSNILQNKISNEAIEYVSSMVCDILKLSELTDSKLKKLAKIFIVNNFQVVSKEESWKSLLNSDAELASEILAQVVTN